MEKHTGIIDSRSWDLGDRFTAMPISRTDATMTDREMLHYVNGSLSAIEDMSMDRMKAAVVKLRSEIKKHLGVE